MKNLVPTWTGSVIREPGLLPVPGSNKKFKRKSREPRRLFPDFPSETLKTDGGVEPSGEGACQGTNPVQRPCRTSEDTQSCSSGFLLGVREDVSPPHSGPLDMRISAPPPVASKAPPFPEISNWPPSISQPLTNRLRHAFHSSFSCPAPGSSRAAVHHAFSVELPLTSQSAPPAPPTLSPSHEHTEESSPKSPRKRVGGTVDGQGRPPEIKAIQQTRRLLANARERTRVHTISAAFEALRKQVPCYSYGQKLSKLAILRIACNYILSLAQLAQLEPRPDQHTPTFSQCVDQCTRTLQAEGRSKKRKVGRLPDEA